MFVSHGQLWLRNIDRWKLVRVPRDEASRPESALGPEGLDNLLHLRNMCAEAQIIAAAWGVQRR